ncbi:hypothetical protein [Oecophyllibacter saccharovorans]|uniref:hypothetical protein n=1 Tax=Oecophyllibacter saccharovorans TaxID=2558360 RepID=UPI001168A71C|nr:hypothetical protein [Oecophyllibacter saccharovorans]TPW36580.1 hypothetical protein E3203_02120 [Oecophyllibacter saccharovorans]
MTSPLACKLISVFFSALEILMLIATVLVVGRATYACAERKGFQPPTLWGILGAIFWLYLPILELTDATTPEKISPRPVEYISWIVFCLLIASVVLAGSFQASP